MKRTFCMVLCCLLVFVCSAGSAVTYTLPEKMEKQLGIGSGLKGSFVLKTEGTNSWLPFISPYAGAEYQLRGMMLGEDLHYYLYQTDAEENQWARTEVYRKEDRWYLRSDMLPGSVFFLPSVGAAADIFNPAAGENPSVASVLWKLLNLSAQDREEIWKPIQKRFEEKLEIWLQQYAAEPQIRRQENGTSVMDLVYIFSAETLKAGILKMMQEALSDDAFISAMQKMMTEEQQAVYLNPNLMYFFEQALDSLNLDFDVSFTRTVSTLGELLASNVELPLDEARTGWNALMMETAGGQITYMLRNTEKTVSVSMPEQKPQEDEYTQFYRFMQLPEEGAENPCTPVSLKMEVKTKVSESTDEENRSHETDHYSITVEQDLSAIENRKLPDSFEDFAPVTAELDLHYSSKYDNRSPTTLAFDFSCTQGTGTVKLYGSVKTASPWVFTPFDIGGAVSLAEMKPEELLTLGTKWLSEAALQIRRNAPEEEAEQTTTEPAPASEEPASASEESAPASEEPAPEQ